MTVPADPSAARVRSTAASSLMTASSDSTWSISGSTDAPAAAASLRTIRPIASSTLARTWATYVRTLTRISASSGMMLLFVPAASLPTVTTAKSLGETSRETIVCSRITVDAAITTGSIDA
jgi:hypothetical protein